MNEKLKPCPFCGKSDSVVLFDEVGRLHYVCCTGQKGGCGARTTLCEKEITAVVTWNRRAPLPDNNALTVDELREMDGQPVWVVYDDDSAMWALVDAGHIGKKLKLTGNWGEQIVLDEHKHHVKAIYRHPPQKGSNNAFMRQMPRRGWVLS